MFKMRQGQLVEKQEAQKALAAKGFTNIILDSNITALEIMVADLKKWMDEAKE